MKEKLLLFLSYLRANVMRKLYPADRYWLAARTTQPLGRKFGIDRGKPIDRYYIDLFLRKNKKYIKGRCLEIGDDRYTKKYGSNVRVDVLDKDKKNALATMYGDLRNVREIIKDNTYDCIIVTQVLGMIDDVQAVISELHRILKPSGALLLTASSLNPTIDADHSFWRFTVQSIKFLLSKHFQKKKIFAASYGNALVGQCFWVGMSQEDLSEKELTYNDPQFSCVVVARAIKKI